MPKITATFLGTGTSQGVPVIACECRVCTSINPKNNRLRSSLLVNVDGKNFVIDTGPDFRQQMLVNDVKMIEAVFFTHEHKDHIAGLDDVRAFNYRSKKDMEVYATLQVQEALKRDFYYAFTEYKYPGVPQINLNLLTDDPIAFNGEQIIPINVMHYKMPVKAFRIGGLTYITDANFIEDKEVAKIEGTEVLVLNALRREPHISHFTLEEALAFIEQIQPKRAYLTHISHLLGDHHQVSNELPENVFLAYDGLEIELS